ncbi:MAG TPA: selenium-binding protein SBP56-related protein [Gemmatimonadaceae bacterium]|nr:selenium-binding protein SBP56-related protein [Gemmatimonadaceae bacterium]
MATWRPDPSFYATPRHAMSAPPEKLAYVALLTPGDTGGRDALGVIDTDPDSNSYGTVVGSVEFPNGGNDLHHLGFAVRGTAGYSPGSF